MIPYIKPTIRAVQLAIYCLCNAQLKGRNFMNGNTQIDAWHVRDQLPGFTEELQLINS